MSGRVILAGFLMSWLKRCVLLTLPHDAITMDVVFSAVQLACGERPAFSSATTVNIQGDLWTMIGSFHVMPKSSPIIDMAYMYLMAWYVMHCLTLMTTILSRQGALPYVQQLEGCTWVNSFIYSIWKTLLNLDSYNMYQCYLDFLGVAYTAELTDSTGKDRFTSLARGPFRWLMNICLDYHILRSSLICLTYPPDSSAMTNYMSITPTWTWCLVGPYSRELRRGTTPSPDLRVPPSYSFCKNRSLITHLVSTDGTQLIIVLYQGVHRQVQRKEGHQGWKI